MVTRFFAVLGICILQTVLVAERIPNLTVVPFPDSRVTLRAVQEHSVFDSVLGENLALRAVSVELENHTDRPVVAIAIRWRWTDQASEKREYRRYSDSFYLPSASVVVAAKSKLLVSPMALLPKELIEQYNNNNVVRADTSDMARLIAASESVSFEIDSIAFSDGEVIGKDQLQYPALITTRNAAAREVLASLQNYKSDRPLQINDLVDEKSANSALGKWKSQLARAALQQPSLATAVKNLASMPTPPRFFKVK